MEGASTADTLIEETTEFSILLFASLKDAMQTDRIAVRVPSTDHTITVGSLLEYCAAQYPRLSRWLPHVKVAVNQEYSQSQQNLNGSDEIAFLPPVAGGASAGNASAGNASAGKSD